MTTASQDIPKVLHQNHLLVQTASTVAPSRVLVNSREFLTAPAVLLVCGVLNGALVPAEALEADVWNFMPVVVPHPRNSQGQALSARSPEVFAQYGVGYLCRTRLGTGQRRGQTVPSLQAELWIDIAQAQAVGGEALQALTMLETQQNLEVSTGFYAQSVSQLGSFHGEPYTEILSDLQPDHLALLPNDIGACNWEAGCGSPRLCVQQSSGCDATHPCAACAAERIPMPEPVPSSRWHAFMAMLRQFVQQEEVPPKPSRPKSSPPAPLYTEMTDQDVREALYSALAREADQDYTNIFIDSTDQATLSFVYRQGERLLLRRWTVDAAGVLTLDPNVEDVQRNTDFIPVAGTEGEAEPPQDSNQDLPQVFDVQAQCPNCLEALTREADGSLASCAVCSLPAAQPMRAHSPQERHVMTQPVVSPVAIKARVNNLITNKHYGWGERDRAMLEALPEATLIRLESQPVLVVPPEPMPPPEPPKTAQEAIAGLPSHLHDMFNAMYRDHQERRQAALAMLLAHKSCPFEQDELQEMSVDRLEKLVAMGAGVDYSGRGLPPPRQLPVVEEPPPPPPDTLSRVVQIQKDKGLR